MTVRDLHQPRGVAVGVAVGIIKPAMLAASKRVWIDGEKIPASGGCIVALNHISHIDPLMAAHFLYDHGRVPRYLAKSGLFTNKVLGGLLTSAGQIPVRRLSTDARGAYTAAVEAVNNGECVVVYPEGTITRDPELWPMTGKSGAARIALETECPVIPVAHWGAQNILAPYGRTPRLVPRRTVTFKVGDPVPLKDLHDAREVSRDNRLVNQATERIMSAITALLEDIRGVRAPDVRFDPRRAGVRPIGNPRKKSKDNR